MNDGDNCSRDSKVKPPRHTGPNETTIDFSVGDSKLAGNADPHQTQPSSPHLDSSPAESATSDLRYRVLRPHAKGGLGEVFVAMDSEVNREVALKEIQQRFANDPSSRSRFILEAEITGGLEHPGIVPLYGRGQYSDGRPYYAMRFIRGDSLKTAIERFHKNSATTQESDPDDSAQPTLQLRKLLGRFIDVCNAIQYAHSRGVLHRDLKPANVMLGKYGETLVVDWGLAKVHGREAQDDVDEETTLRPPSAHDMAATQMGSAFGTPGFMPPEQAAGRIDELGPACDIYSLGATLYYLLTGKPPFRGNQRTTLLTQIQQGDFPRPREIQPGVPKALEAVCLKAMALNPGDRYSSAGQLAEEIEQWLADEPVKAWREPLFAGLGRWTRRHQTLVATTIAVIIIMGLSIGNFMLFSANRKVRHARDMAEQRRAEADRQRDRVELLYDLFGRADRVKDTVDRMQLEQDPVRKEEYRKSAETAMHSYLRDLLQIASDVETKSNAKFQLSVARAELHAALFGYMRGDAESTVTWCGKAIPRLEQSHGRVPADQDAKRVMKDAIELRSKALHKQKRYVSEAADLQYFLEFDDVPNRGRLRLQRAYALARGEQHADAAREATKLTSEFNADWGIVYGTAVVHALCYAGALNEEPRTAAQQQTAERYAITAVQILGKLKEAGAFEDATIRNWLSNDESVRDQDLDSLRPRKDFLLLIEQP